LRALRFYFSCSVFYGKTSLETAVNIWADWKGLTTYTLISGR